ncbi:MAG: SPOR domain-containing protein [Spirochaetaceae bacterium]|nr:SPOR domain-containing protein [Spirochaetaceae bacterium]
MEQKKILWIIASVGVFLLVVMGAALIINRPAQGVEPSLASLQAPNDTWVLPPTNNPVVQPADSLQNQNPAVVEPVAGSETPVATTNDENILDSMTVYSGTTNVYGSNGTTTIDLNSIKEAIQQATVTATNQAGVEAVAAAKPEATAKATSDEVVKSVAKPAAKPESKPAATSSKASAKPAATSSKVVDQYWVQVASVTNKRNADNAKAALAANKIESEIFTHKADNGQIYYRLRVGPYTTKTEAEYWKGRIVLIEEFADIESYITNTSAKAQ